MMKLKGLYEIHALIGKCHLHNKKKSTYSICLKMGTKAIANTEYKMPTDDQINYNTELILKIDKTLYENGGKLSLIVAMQTEDKDKKIIGNVLANYKQKGLQTLRVAQCSCKDKSFQVNVQFEVVNIQVHNNNQHNNKFQSPNNSEMKDLKKALTISREKELVKSSRTKLSTATKSPVEKTQSKLNKQKLQSRLKEQLNPDLSSLTTKITPHNPKSAEQSKQLIKDLRNKILELETQLQEGLNKHKTARRQINTLQSEVEMLRKENECLLQILTFEQEKSSAALEYISYLTQKISQNNLFDNHFHQYFELIQIIKNSNSPMAKDIKSVQPRKQPKDEYLSYNVQPIEQKVEHIDQNTQKLIQQLEEYKTSIIQLRQKISDLENDDMEKSNTIVRIEREVVELEQYNSVMSAKNQQLQNSINDYQTKLSSIKLQYNKLQSHDKTIQKRLTQTINNYQRSKQQLKQLNLRYQSTLKDNQQLQQTILKLQNKIQQLQSIKQKLQLTQQQLRKAHTKDKPCTPTESQIILKKTRFYDGDEIDNLINQMNTQCTPYDQSPAKDLLVASRKKSETQNQPFLSRNKSQSLLKDMQQSDPEQVGGQQYQIAPEQTSQKQSLTKSVKKISIPEHKKQVQKYNYDYDIDSLNYFNNFEETHERMQMSGEHQNNSSEIQNDIGIKP